MVLMNHAEAHQPQRHVVVGNPGDGRAGHLRLVSVACSHPRSAPVAPDTTPRWDGSLAADAAAGRYTRAMGEPWERTHSRALADYGFFRLRQDTNIHPRHGRPYDFYVLEFPHWVNIIPLTSSDEVIFVRQFRHGTREVTWEIPGGIIDPGESPKQAALREMQEETGYTAADALELGWVHP